MKKKLKPIMLPTDEASNIILDISEAANNPLIFIPDRKNAELKGNTNQNLYLVSDEEIKEPCWCINKNGDTLYFIKGSFKEATKDWNKVIATTNKSLSKKCNGYPTSYHENEDRCPGCGAKCNFDLDMTDEDTCWECRKDNVGLPQIPESFIKYFVEKNGKVDEVEVEMSYCELDYQGRLDIAVTDNDEVIIHLPEEKMYSREEVENFGLWLGINFKKNKNKDISILFDEWIEKNFK